VCVILSGGNVAVDRLGDLLDAAVRCPRDDAGRAAAASPARTQRVVFDGSFVGPLAPPRPMARSLGRSRRRPRRRRVVPEVISTLPAWDGPHRGDVARPPDPPGRRDPERLVLHRAAAAGLGRAGARTAGRRVPGHRRRCVLASRRGGPPTWAGRSSRGSPAFLGYLAMSIESSVPRRRGDRRTGRRSAAPPA